MKIKVKLPQPAQKVLPEKFTSIKQPAKSVIPSTSDRIIDKLEILNPYFIKMQDSENNLLPQVLANTKIGKAFVNVLQKFKDKKYEIGFIFDKNGKLIAQTRSKNQTDAYWSSSDWIKLLNHTEKGLETEFIHNHPINMTFSSPDLNTFLQFNVESMYAKTEEGYAFLHRTKPLTEKDIELIKLAIRNDTRAAIKISKISKDNSEIAQKLNEFRDEQYKKLAEQIGLKYEYMIPSKSNYNLEAIPNFKKIYYTDIKKNYIEAGYSSTIADSIINSIYETPIDSLYI